MRSQACARHCGDGATALIRPPSEGEQESMYVSATSLREALRHLYGSAGHLLKIWFALKKMGFREGGSGISIDTSNSTPSLKRLFAYGAPDNGFYVPFAHTPRYLTMKHDAARAIIQTNVQRWATSGSVVTCDPTDFLNIENTPDRGLVAAPARRYPLGLGMGASGFALEDGSRVAIPLTSFAVWYGRQTEIPEDADAPAFLIAHMLSELNISAAEKAAVFVDDALSVETGPAQMSDADIYAICSPFVEGRVEVTAEVHPENFPEYSRRIRSMVSDLNAPVWMRKAPETELRELIESGAKAILLYGPPRTGKTRYIDQLVPRSSIDRCTIQIHDGWGYDHLVEGFKPDGDGKWDWVDGPLKEAIEHSKKFIVLEEINRTSISQSLGEVFSLVEDAYRGEENSIILRSGKKLFIPSDTLIIMTMNTVDKSTEEVDDALMGRVAAVEFPPRSEDLVEMLTHNGVNSEYVQKISEVYIEILDGYPLGHGYFAGINGAISNSDFIRYYKSRVRPVLMNHFGELQKAEIDKIDNVVDQKFG
jgi:5-methylcytosine-specific restriction protein B